MSEYIMANASQSTLQNNVYNDVRILLSSPEPDIDWGPQRDPLYIVVPITALYIIIFITGVVGNISTCIVISRNKTMHTATNYYLFSLAISDLLLLICGLPPDMYGMWYKYPYIFGEAFCVLQGFAAETSANATVLTITAFTVERYVAICHPFLSHTMSKLSRAVKYVVAVWIVAMMLAIPQAMSFEIFRGGREEQRVCTVTRTVIPHAFVISTLLFFVTPMSLITVLYVLIGLQLHKSTVGPSRGSSVRLKHRAVAHAPTNTRSVVVLNGNVVDGIRDNRPDTPTSAGIGGAAQEEDGRKNFARNAQGTKHVVKMLVAVVVAFCICWAPFHAQRLFAVYSADRSDNTISAYRVLNYISGILYFLSTSINPFLYHIMSHKFRAAFKDTFKGCPRRSRRSEDHRCYSTLSGRSSQLNSHSNTDSCSRQSSLRYLDAEMARLRDSQRPLVVSFKRTRSAFPKQPQPPTVLDAELQEALDSLDEESLRVDLFEKVRRASCAQASVSYVEVHRLEPTHICPASGARCGEVGCCYLKKFQRRRERTERHKRGCHRGTREAAMCNDELTKSSTMPQIVHDQEAAVGGAGDKREPNAGKACLDVIGGRRDERSNSCSQLEFHCPAAQESHNEHIIIPVT